MARPHWAIMPAAALPEETGCPVCGTNPSGTLDRCPTCGLSRILWTDARESLQEPPPSAGGVASGAIPKEAAAGAPAASGPTLEEEMEGLARQLESTLRVGEVLHVDRAAIAAAMAQATVLLAQGQLEPAHAALKAAVTHSEEEMEAGFDSYVRELEDREGALREEGVSADVAAQLARARKIFHGKGQAEGVRVLREAEESLHVLEQEWRGLKETLLRLEGIRDVSRRLGIETAEATERLDGVRKGLASGPQTAKTLQQMAARASASLVSLHENLREKIREGVQEGALGFKDPRIPEDERRVLEGLWKQVVRHSREGHMLEAGEELVGFQETLRKIQERQGTKTPPGARFRREPTKEAEAQAPAAPPPRPSHEKKVSGSLPEAIREAKELAGIVRTLQRDGVDVREAAQLLREGTAHLKALELEPATEALRRVRDILRGAGRLPPKEGPATDPQ